MAQACISQNRGFSEHLLHQLSILLCPAYTGLMPIEFICLVSTVPPPHPTLRHHVCLRATQQRLTHIPNMYMCIMFLHAARVKISEPLNVPGVGPCCHPLLGGKVSTNLESSACFPFQKVPTCYDLILSFLVFILFYFCFSVMSLHWGISLT